MQGTFCKQHVIRNPDFYLRLGPAPYRSWLTSKQPFDKLRTKVRSVAAVVHNL
jgi:hypothetical protein